MTETDEASKLVASLTAALDEEEAAAKAAMPGIQTGRWRFEEVEGGLFGARDGDDDTYVATSPYGGLGEYGPHIARQDPARTLRKVAAHRDLIAAILSEPHHRWPGVSACLKATFPDEECACGRDARVERLLSISAGIYEEPQS